MARSKYQKHDADPERTTVESDSQSEAEYVSRSARKRESDAMKALGMQLSELSPRQLADMELGETLFKAITDYQSITSNSAKRRQRGYIGGLLREDPDTARDIAKRHAAITQHDADAKRVHHELEDWRERLIADDAALTDFLNLYDDPDTSVQQLRTMIRRARTAKDEAQRKIATRALYRKIASFSKT